MKHTYIIILNFIGTEGNLKQGRGSQTRFFILQPEEKDLEVLTGTQDVSVQQKKFKD
jgi:hypothetical protein